MSVIMISIYRPLATPSNPQSHLSHLGVLQQQQQLTAIRMEEEECQLGLGLGIGGGDFLLDKGRGRGGRKTPVQFDILFPELGIKEQHIKRFRLMANRDEDVIGTEFGETCDDRDKEDDHRRAKKTKLTIEQSTLLENSFRERNTLTPGQKNELAQQLNLRPRQIEVWFQNRRARTKLKQTEVNREFLKTYCESLTDENRRLRKELMELRSVKLGSQFSAAQLQKAARSRICTACQNMAKDGSKCTSLSTISRRGPNYSSGACHGMKDSSMTTT